MERGLEYDLSGLSLSEKPKCCKHRKWAGMRFRAATFAKSEVFKSFLSTAVNCHRNAPESNTRQKGWGKDKEKIFRPRRDFINYSVQPS